MSSSKGEEVDEDGEGKGLVVKGRWAEAEPVIALDPRASYWYAMNIVKGIFPLGEKVISLDPELSYFYAINNSLLLADC